MTVNWRNVDTVLLDMDGTLLDLHFDNFFWGELIPAEYARAHGLDDAAGRAWFQELCRQRSGTLAWYCLDHWTQALGIDLVTLKRRHLHRVAWLPGACHFLDRLAAHGMPRVLATNAHGTTLALKLAQTGLADRVDAVHSSHDYGAAKEQAAFWEAFRDALAFDPVRTVLIDDNLHVLRAARAFGIAQTVLITRPDSTRDPVPAPLTAAAGSVVASPAADGVVCVPGVGELAAGLEAR